MSTYSQELVTSDSAGAAGATAIVNYTEAISNDTSYTISNGTNNGSSSNDIGDGGDGATYGATTSNCLTLQSTATFNNASNSNEFTIEDASTDTYISDGTTFQSSTTFTTAGGGSDGSETSDAGTTAQTYSVIFDTTTLSSISSVRNITSNVDTTTSFWTVSGRYATTQSASTTAISNQTSQTVDVGGGVTITENNPITESFDVSFTSVLSTSQQFDVSQEFGTVVLANQATDWLWSFKTSDLPTFTTVASLLTDVAESFTQATFWNNWQTSQVSFAMGTDTFALTFTEASTSYSWNFITSSDTTTLTATSGDNFPRDTYTTTAPVWTTSGTSFSQDSSTFAGGAVSTVEGTSLALLISNFTSYATYQVGLSDIATTSLNSTTLYYATTTFVSALSAYVAEGDSEGDEFGAGIEQTTLLPNLLYLSQLTDAASIYERVPAVGAFIAPQQLQSDSNMGFGGNLQFGDGASVYYPFLSGVYPKVNVPGFDGTFSATGTNAHTYKYAWKTSTDGATLMVSDKSAVSGSVTVTSGQFSTSSDVATSFVDQQTVFGGFAYNTDPETAYYPARAVYGTHVSGSVSSTYKSVSMEPASTTLRGDMIIETSAAAFVAWQGTLGNGATPYLAFPRNSE